MPPFGEIDKPSTKLVVVANLEFPPLPPPAPQSEPVPTTAPPAVVWRQLPVAMLVIAKLEVVALVEVEFVAVNFCKVVEPTTNKSPVELKVEVAVWPNEATLAVNFWKYPVVEVASVVVERVMVLKMCAPVQVGVKDWSMVKVGWEPITKAVVPLAMLIPVLWTREVVAAEAKVFTPVAYSTCGAAMAEEVAIPPHVIAGVAPPEEMIGQVAVTAVTVPCGIATQPNLPVPL